MNTKIFNQPFSPRSSTIAVCTALGSALCIALLSGCGSVMRSDFEPPALAIPEQWQNTTVNEQVRVDPWWQQFHQPELDKLVSQVLSTNNDLTIATLTLRKARLQAGLTRDDLYPQLSA
ncbi:MAG: TolC family protein, partial [Shewanella sp.]|nr:TolC family protein [Shewanella sp.]